ncbi:MAG: hypothetical protein V7L05_05965 [Nostoc sp.]
MKTRPSGLFQIDIQTKRVQKVKRRYLERASQTVEEISFYPDFKIDEDAVSREIQLLGWRVYVTNQNQAQLSLSK